MSVLWTRHRGWKFSLTLPCGIRQKQDNIGARMKKLIHMRHPIPNATPHSAGQKAPTTTALATPRATCCITGNGKVAATEGEQADESVRDRIHTTPTHVLNRCQRQDIHQMRTRPATAQSRHQDAMNSYMWGACEYIASTPKINEPAETVQLYLICENHTPEGRGNARQVLEVNTFGMNRMHRHHAYLSIPHVHTTLSPYRWAPAKRRGCANN